MNELSLEQVDDHKTKFFDAIKNENIAEIILFFKNENYKVWTYKEEDDYTGIYIINYNSIT